MDPQHPDPHPEPRPEPRPADPHPWAPGPGRNETPEQWADRRWLETLQEVRVAQTGAQILFAFLLGVAFTPRFAQLGGFDRNLYITAVVLGAAATGTLVAPVPVHLFAAGRGLKPQLVHYAQWFMTVGMTLLAFTITAVVLLLLRVVTDPTTAWLITGLILGWLTVCWLLLPALVRRHGVRRR